MFDTMQMGRRIRAARIEKNMTQTELADAMGVSFQAVSNWERGNSMPDIGKLPELCSLLGVTFEELAGSQKKEAQTVERVMAGERITLQEAAEVAPILPPETIQESAEQAQKQGEEVDFAAVRALAPFLDEGYLDAVAEQLGEDHIDKMIDLAPFLSQKTLELLAGRAKGKDFHLLVRLTPFLDEKTLLDAAMELTKTEPPDIQKLTVLAPFLGENAMTQLVGELKGCTLRELIPLAPFLPQDVLIKMTKQKQ